MKTSEIITAIIAIYGAVLSTINLVRQHLSDRVQVTLRKRNVFVTTGIPGTPPELVTVLLVTNMGRRPVTITTCGGVGLHAHRSVVGVCVPPLPREITESQIIECMLDPDEFDVSEIDYWTARDSHERIYKLREASWFKHWRSTWQRMWSHGK